MSVELCKPLTEDFKGYVVRRELEDLLKEEIERSFDGGFVFVYGMGGSGKTTLVNKILRDLDYDFSYIQVVDEGLRYVGKFKEVRKLDYTDGETAYWIVKKLYESFNLRSGLKEIAKKLYDVYRIVHDIYRAVAPMLGHYMLELPKPPSVEELRNIIGKLGSSEFERITKHAYDRLKRLDGKVVVVIDDLNDATIDTAKSILKVVKRLCNEKVCFVVVYGSPRIYEKAEKERRKADDLIDYAEDVGALMFHVPPMRDDEVRELVKSLGYDVDEEGLEVLKRKAANAPRRVCMVLRLAERELNKRSFSGEELERVIPNDHNRQISNFLRLTFEGCLNAFRVSALMPNFSEEELKGILKIKLGDEQRAVDETNAFLDKEVLEEYEGIYRFKWDYMWMVEFEAENLSEDERRKIHEAIYEFFKGVKPSLRSLMAVVYYGKRLLEFKRDESILKKIFESSKRISEWAYSKGYARLSFEFGLRAFNLASDSIEALRFGERVTFYAFEVQADEKVVKDVLEKAEYLYRGVNDEEHLYFGAILKNLAYYYLELLSDSKKAESFLKRGFEVLEKIRDDFLRFDLHFALLNVKAELEKFRMNFDKVEECLEEKKRLLENYRDKIGEKKYYESLAVLESRLGSLAWSLCKFDEAERHIINDLKYSQKLDGLYEVATARLNLALVKMIKGEFRKAVEEKIEGVSLYDAIKIFKDIGDLDGLSRAEGLTLLSTIHGCKEVFDINPNNLRDEALKAWIVSKLAYLELVEGKFEEALKGFEYAFKTFERLGLLNRFIPLILITLTKHRVGELSLSDVLRELGEIIDYLEKKNVKLSLWAVENLLKALEEEGLSERVLKEEVLKLLLV